METEGGVSTVFESTTEWQRAWAQFRTADSAIDYVRTSGAGADPMLLNAGQVTRCGRNWWRILLDLYGAADVVMPLARSSGILLPVPSSVASLRAMVPTIAILAASPCASKKRPTFPP